MVFDVSLPTRGLETSQILSDEAHYGTFICGACDKLVSLDSVVTTSCRHPHCRKCIESASMLAFMRQEPCQCPKCDGNIQQQPQINPTDCMQFGPVTVMVRPLPLVETLAFQCLRKVRVACHGCDWHGAYGDYLQHAIMHAFQQPENSAAVEKDQSEVLQPALPKQLQQTPDAPTPQVGSVNEPRANPAMETSTVKDDKPKDLFEPQPHQTDRASPAITNDVVLQSAPAKEVVSQQAAVANKAKTSLFHIVPYPLPEQRMRTPVHCGPSPQFELQTAQKNTAHAIPNEVIEEDFKISNIRSLWKVRERREQELMDIEAVEIPRKEKDISNRNLVGTINDANEDDKLRNSPANTSQMARFGEPGEECHHMVLTSDSHSYVSDNNKSRRPDHTAEQIHKPNVDYVHGRGAGEDENYLNQSSGLSVIHHSNNGNNYGIRTDVPSAMQNAGSTRSDANLFQNPILTRPYPEFDRNGICQIPLKEQQPEQNLRDWNANDRANYLCGDIQKFEKVYTVDYDKTISNKIIHPSGVDQRFMRNDHIELLRSNPQLFQDKSSVRPNCEFSGVSPVQQPPFEHEHGVVHPVHEGQGGALKFCDPPSRTANVQHFSQYLMRHHSDNEVSHADIEFYREKTISSQERNAKMDMSVNYQGLDATAQATSLQQNDHQHQQSRGTVCQSHSHLQHLEQCQPVAEEKRYPVQGQNLQQLCDSNPVSRTRNNEFQLRTFSPIGDLGTFKHCKISSNKNPTDQIFEGTTSVLVGNVSGDQDKQSCYDGPAEQPTGSSDQICDAGKNEGAELHIQQALSSTDEVTLDKETELSSNASGLLTGIAESADAVSEPVSCRQSTLKVEYRNEDQSDQQESSLPNRDYSVGSDSKQPDELSTFIVQKNRRSLYDSTGKLIVNPLDCESFYESVLLKPDEDSQRDHLLNEDEDGSMEKIEDEEDNGGMKVGSLENSKDDEDDGSIEDLTAVESKETPDKKNGVKDNDHANQQRIMNASIDSLGFSDGDLDETTDRQQQVQHGQMNASTDSLRFSENDLNASLNNGFGDEDDPECCEDEGDGEYGRIIKKAEKLKKQANAKFNKAELAEALALYSKGIMILESSQLQECAYELLSGLFANRSVAFYRQKQFKEAIEDCDSAIKYNPNDDKARIRKWRAMMALGKCEEAFVYIRMGLREVPSSKKIELQCQKSSKEMAAYTKVKALMETGDIKLAKQVYGEVMDSSENLFLLILTARVDTALGDFDGAFEKINRSLKINPNYIDALELHGFMYFIQGDTNKASDLLLEAFSKNKESVQLKIALRRIQRTHLAYSDARAAVQRGDHKEAVEKFSAAIKESAPLPPVAPLYSILRTERAESNLLGQQYIPALKDCQDVTNTCPKHAHAWVVRAKVLLALGKVKDAKQELDKIRRLVGTENPVVEECYQNIDFELRAEKLEDDLRSFQNELESGTCSRLPPSGNIKSFERKMIHSDHSTELPRNSVKSLSRRSSLTETIRSNTELNTGTIDMVIEEEYPSSFDSGFVDQSDRDLQRKSKGFPSGHRSESSRSSSSKKDSAQFVRYETASSERRDRDDREQRCREDRDRRGISASDHVDKKNRSDGDRRCTGDSNRQKGSRDDHDRRSRYSRSEGSSRRLSTARIDETEHNDKSDPRREGERRRSDDRGDSRRSNRPEEDRRRSSRTSDEVSRRSSRNYPGRNEFIGSSKHSSRRSSFHSGSREERGHTRRDSDLSKESHSDDQQEK